MMRRLRAVFKTRPRIRTKADVRRFVVTITGMALCLTLLLDGANQTIFFVSWDTAFRSWALDVVIVLAVTIPVTFTVGGMQRQLTEAKAALVI